MFANINRKVILAFGLILTLAAGLANSATSTVAYQVSASADDGYATSSIDQDTASAHLKIGDDRTYAVPYQMSAMRFNNVDIPRSATITSAYLKICSINTDYRGQIYGSIAAEASDNPADFSGRLISDAILTTASIDWDFKTAWSPDTQYVSGDISNIVQEVVNRPGFSSGNSIAIYYSTRELSGKARSFASYEYNPASAAVLEITYETYTISGHITTTEASPLEGVVVSAGADIEGDVTDASGYYELKIPPGWSGTVTVSKTDWGFSPANQPYSNVSSDQPNQDYTAFQPKISGYVKDGNSLGIEGVSVSADNSGGLDATDATGFYELTVPYDWSGTVNVFKPGWVISPSYRSYTDITTEQIDQNYLAAFTGQITVNGDGTADFINIQPAIDVAQTGYTIIVSEGIYYENINFGGKDIVLRSTDPNEPTIVAATIIDANESGRVVVFSGTETSSCRLSGLTIRNGRSYYGGGILGRNTKATISDCIINNNTSSDIAGGMIDCDGLINNCTITNNSARLGVGGLRGCDGTIKNCTISGNEESGLELCNGLIENCTISGNSGRGLSGCDGTIDNCTISDNSGGGLSGCDGTIRHCTISGNSIDSPGNYGGGLNGCNGLIENCVIINNSAYSQGGGLRSCDGTIQNCIISNNSSYSGGGLKYCDATIRNCTISNNSANIVGGLYDCDGSMQNCIVWGNLDDQIYAGATPNYSCIQDWTGGGIGNISDNPLFVDANDGDYHLSTYSPCIDTGDPSYIAGPDETDIDGDPRIIRSIDIGADEFSGPYIGLNNVSFYFTAYGKGDTSVAGQELVISNTGLDGLNWHIEVPNDCNWLSVIPSSGNCTTEPNIVSLMIDVNEVDYGSYSCQLTVSDPCAANSPQLVTVNLEVLGPELTINPTQLYFEIALDEPNDSNQVLSIQNTGYDTLNWDINIPEGCGWLNASEISGQSTGEFDEVVLNIDHNSVDAGFYQCEILISALNAGNSPQVIPVELRVLEIKGERHVPSEYDTIQAAIDAAVDGDEVIIHPGIYKGEGNCYIGVYYKSITIRSIDPNDPETVVKTIIDGSLWYSDNQVVGIYTYNNPSVFDSTIVIGGLTIKNCNGAGIVCNYGRPIIHNCIITDNLGSPWNYGGAILCFENAPIISNCIIRRNFGGEVGTGGIAIHNDKSSGDSSISNCLISNNYNYYSRRGGVDCRGANLTISNCTISNNIALNYYTGGQINNNIGKGIFIENSNVIIKNSIIWDNLADDGTQIAILDFSESQSPPIPAKASISYNDIKGGEEQVFIAPDYDSYIAYLRYGTPIDPNLIDPNTLSWGTGNLDTDPCFAKPGYLHDNDTPIDANDDFWVEGDYHLKSQAGRWQWSKYIGIDQIDGFIDLVDFSAFASYWKYSRSPVYIHRRVLYPYVPADFDNSGIVDFADLRFLLDSYLTDYKIGQWVADDVNSLCIDAGDPNSDWSAELWPHGKRINMGAYGGTPQASMSLSNVGNIANLNNDCADIVDFSDLALIVEKWCERNILLKADINHDGVVDFADYAIFASHWLEGIE